MRTILNKKELLLAERILRLGHWGEARKMLGYIVPHPDVAIACGDKNMQESSWEIALPAYLCAASQLKDNPALQRKLVELGDIFCANNVLDSAFKAYVTANACSHLGHLGILCVKHKQYSLAHDCFRRIGSLKELKELGQLVLRQKTVLHSHLQIALNCFTASDAKTDLIDVGERYLKEFYKLAPNQRTTNDIGDAKKAFRAAGERKRLVDCGRAYLALAENQCRSDGIESAIEVYQEAGEPIPLEDIIRLLDLYLLKGWVNDQKAACHYLLEAGIEPLTTIPDEE